MINGIVELFSNYHLICPLVAFFAAQFIKFVITWLYCGKVDFRKFLENGGMPSSHTSTVWALSVSIGRTEGFYSSTAAVSVILTVIVMIDAMGVRRATGENSKAINQIMRELFEWKPFEYEPKNVRKYKGHKPTEVLIGAIIGFIVPLLIEPF